MTHSPVKHSPARHGSLQDLLDEVGDDLVGYFYHETAAPHLSRSASAGAHLPAEFTNWRDEQRAWREAAALFDRRGSRAASGPAGGPARDDAERVRPPAPRALYRAHGPRPAIRWDTKCPQRGPKYPTCRRRAARAGRRVYLAAAGSVTSGLIETPALVQVRYVVGGEPAVVADWHGAGNCARP